MDSKQRIAPQQPLHHHVNPDADPADFDYGYTHAHTHFGPHRHNDDPHTEYVRGDNADGRTPFHLDPGRRR